MTNDETRETKYAQKATYTDDNFEDYYRTLVERWCTENNIAFRLDEWDGARENMRDDAFGFDPETGYNDDTVTYTDWDLINEYLYFCLYDDMQEYLETTPFHGRNLAPVHDDQEMTYEMNVYRDDDQPYSHYDTGRMDLYRGTYTFDKATCTFHFNEPTKVVFDV